MRPSARTAHRLRVIEAASYMLVARAAIRCVPFRHLLRAFTRSARQPPASDDVRLRAIAEVRGALRSATARLPGTTSCFARAAAAQAMLRRRRVGTTLYYGATTAGGTSLRAHVWLMAGDFSVVGREDADGYAIVARYSNGTEEKVNGKVHA
jgi:hypothetical protein